MGVDGGGEVIVQPVLKSAKHIFQKIRETH
jgi:hypothetical protein